MSSLPVEEVTATNGIIAAPGLLVTDFGGYVRRPHVYVCIIGVYYSGVALSDVDLFLVPALGAAGNDRILIAASNPTATDLARSGRWVPTNPATGLPFILGVIKDVATNANVRILWCDMSRP